MQDKLRHVAFSGMLYFLLVVRFCIAGLFLIATIQYMATENNPHPTYGLGISGDLYDFLPIVIGLGIAVLDFIAIVGLFRWKMWGLQLHVAIMLFWILISLLGDHIVLLACIAELLLFIGSLFAGDKYTKAWPQLEM